MERIIGFRNSCGRLEFNEIVNEGETFIEIGSGYDEYNGYSESIVCSFDEFCEIVDELYELCSRTKQKNEK